MSKLVTYEIVLGKTSPYEKWSTRETRESVLEMLAARGLNPVKKGYTTWALYEKGARVGSVREVG